MKLGDAVKKVTDAMGIPQCGGCADRQRRLNELSDKLSRVFGAERRAVQAEIGRLKREGGG